MKVCIKCEIEKELSEFGKRPDSKDGYRNDCKKCRKEFMKLYKELNSESLSIKKKEYNIKNKEVISLKNKEYNIKNKETIKEKKKEYCLKNKESLSIKSKEYRENNKETIRQRKKRYYENNKEKENNRKNIWAKNKRKSDNLFKLRCNIRTLIGNAIRNSGFRKEQLRLKKTDIILGCSTEEFKEYLESLFLKDMSWENYGDWHMDHKIPVSWGIDEEEIILLNHFTNFQPLWSFDNQSKGNRYST